MNNTKFNLVSVVLFVVLIGLGVLAFFTLTPPKRYSAKNQDKTDQQVVVNDINESTAGTVVDADQPVTETPVTTTTPEPTTTTTTNSQYADLIAKLQKMIDDKVVLKAGNKGSQVGTIQTFLNIYNKTNTKVDNDFGPSLTTAVKSYQSKNGLPSTGQVAEKTLSKMIEWLNK